MNTKRRAAKAIVIIASVFAFGLISVNYNYISAQIKNLAKGLTTVDTSKVGTYQATYTVADSSGNVSTATKTVQVVAVKDKLMLIDGSDGQAAKNLIGGNFGALDSGANADIAVKLFEETGNRYLSIEFYLRPDGFGGLWCGTLGRTNEPAVLLPAQFSQYVKGVSFHGRANATYPINLKVEAKRADNSLESGYFSINGSWQEFELPITNPATLKEIVFVIERHMQPSEAGFYPTGSLSLDDIALTYDRQVAFPPQNDEALLAFAKQTAINYFVWNYREAVAGFSGFVPERASFNDMISVSGLGYALAAYIIAEQDGILIPSEAKAKVSGVLNWLNAITAENGNGGWHGFYFHFLKPDGSRSGESEVGTVDWAILAAGLRVTREYYAADPQITGLVDAILAKPDWSATINPDGRISHGFDGLGVILASSWGTSFTEEADLVDLEAVASGQIDPMVFDSLTRVMQNGYWPSWFGSAFTYNWLQLWTGPIEPYATNSQLAYQQDWLYAQSLYGNNLMGFSACENFIGLDANNFLRWEIYYGEIGSDNHLTTDPIYNFALCPYAAAQALPFLPAQAKIALSQFSSMGYIHPMVGFPDMVRMADFPAGISGPVPNWIQVSIDQAAIWMSIEQIRPDGSRIADLYLADPAVSAALAALQASFS